MTSPRLSPHKALELRDKLKISLTGLSELSEIIGIQKLLSDLNEVGNKREPEMDEPNQPLAKWEIRKR